MSNPYDVGTAAPARRALSELLPVEVATAAIGLITGPLLTQPRRLGRALSMDLEGVYSARLGRDWRVLYEIDERARVVTVLDIRHQSTAYRPR